MLWIFENYFIVIDFFGILLTNSVAIFTCINCVHKLIHLEILAFLRFPQLCLIELNLRYIFDVHKLYFRGKLHMILIFSNNLIKLCYL